MLHASHSVTTVSLGLAPHPECEPLENILAWIRRVYISKNFFSLLYCMYIHVIQILWRTLNILENGESNHEICDQKWPLY